MKKLISALASALFGLSPSSKSNDPVQWRFVAKKEDVATFSLNFMAIIQPPWSICMERLNTNEGSLFDIEYKPNIYIIFKGGLQERGAPVEFYDFKLKSDVKMYKGHVNFVQLVKIIVDEPISIKGTLHYVVGDGIDQMKTYKKDFEFELNG